MVLVERLGDMIPAVFFGPKMVAEVASFSPSARKPREVVGSWRLLAPDLDVRAPEPVSIDDFCRAHDRDYVEGVLSRRLPNGFGTLDASVAASLPYTSGAMLGAARHALDHGVAAAACSGFHHAGYFGGQGFCTFNGLMVAALALHHEGRIRRVGILDADHHYGNGTDDILRHLGIDWVRHVTVGATHYRAEHAVPFMRELPSVVAGFADCDLLLYQAGADPHIDDPLGGWLTDTQLAQRDHIVFEGCRGLGLPVAWNLAGGYQTPLRKVLDIHDETLRACRAVYSGAATSSTPQE